MLEINIRNLQPIEIGRTTPFRFENKILKLEKIPNWSFFEQWIEKRDDLDSQKTYVENEYWGALLAKSMGVYTPKVKLEKIRLVFKGKQFTTRVAIREWLSNLDHETFTSVKQLSIRCCNPKICHRLDWMYIILCDLILANWNRTARNFLYNKTLGKCGTLVAIDWESCFDYDKLPLTRNGIKQLFDDFLFDPHFTGILSIPIQIFGTVWQYIKTHVNYDLLKSIDRRLIHRIVHLEETMRKFLAEFKIGLINQERLENASPKLQDVNCIR